MIIFSIFVLLWCLCLLWAPPLPSYPQLLLHLSEIITLHTLSLPPSHLRDVWLVFSLILLISSHSLLSSHLSFSIFSPSFQLGEPLIYCTSTAVPMATLGVPMFLFVACALVFFLFCVCAAVFRKNVKASAVCRFSLSDVQEAFQGPYMENEDSGSKWKEYTGKIPDPRPGTVNTLAHTHRHTYMHCWPLSLFNTKWS